MAQNTTIACVAGVWTLVTSNDVSKVRVANLSQHAVWLQATEGAVTPDPIPTSLLGAVPLLPNQVMVADITLADLWPGVDNANRVYALAPEGGSISASHA